MATYKELLAQRAELEKQIEATRSLEVAAAIAQAKQLIAEYGLTATDLGFRFAVGAPSVVTKVRSPVAAKYRGPQGETWSGRGKAPKWLTSLIDQGREKDEFLLAKG
ncbi:MAG: H-NS histone family protein [Dokdonella sp.]|nr:MAG: H-NS histone family protein [Dokdonella sp.]